MAEHAPPPPFLRLVLPARWRCTHVVPLRPDDAPDERRIRDMAAEGIRRIGAGPLREEGLELLVSGGLDFSLQPPARGAILQRMLDTLQPDRPWTLPRGGPLLEIGASGGMDERMAPLWISLMASAGIAAGMSSRVVDPGWVRVLPPEAATATLPARPRFVLADHLLLLSSHDGRGHAHLTTIGLERLGILELQLMDVPPDTLGGLASLLNGLAWNLLQLAQLTPPAGERLHLAVPAEIAVLPQWVSGATGRPLPAGHGPWDPGLPPIRLTPHGDSAHPSWLKLGPPRGWRRGRKAWARRLVEASGHALVSPPSPTCGHEPRGGH